MAASADGEGSAKNVSEVFDEGLKLYNELTKSYEATNSLNIQGQVKKSMAFLEDATRLVSVAGMFSANETVDEVGTGEIKFFLLPALLGTLSLKLCIPNRLEVVNTAEVYFKDFLNRCKCYGIIDFDIPEPEESVAVPVGVGEAFVQSFNISKMACQRNIKIQRFKEQKQMEKQLMQLENEMSILQFDEDIKRSYYLTLIKSFASQAIDELEYLYSEKPLIEHRAAAQAEEVPEKPHKNIRPRKPLTPIIITANEVQKKVFGAGYPGLPVMTVDEFYEQRGADGEHCPRLPDPDAPKTALKEDVPPGDVATEQVETGGNKTEPTCDNPDLKAREDTHCREHGNKMNQS